MFKKEVDRRKDITKRLFQDEIKNNLYFRCGGEYCPFLYSIDKAFKVLAKVRKGVYDMIPRLLSPIPIEHQENNRTIHQQIMVSGFEYIGSNLNLPAPDYLEKYCMHITSRF